MGRIIHVAARCSAMILCATTGGNPDHFLRGFCGLRSSFCCSLCGFDNRFRCFNHRFGGFCHSFGGFNNGFCGFRYGGLCYGSGCFWDFGYCFLNFWNIASSAATQQEDQNKNKQDDVLDALPLLGQWEVELRFLRDILWHLRFDCGRNRGFYIFSRVFTAFEPK